jgi:bis(5'-nucleosyl)-tetraphosphatase (symmetrical)
MATYAIGDVQGCFESLLKLIDKIQFDPQHDFLWFAGDLVNRGPHSLEVLRFVKNLGDRAITVLGNHDLYLLALHSSENATAKSIKNKEGSAHTLDSVLTAPDVTDLLDWLRHQPLIHYDPSLNFALVHAGLAPQWDIFSAISYAHEVENVLRGEQFLELMHHMYGSQPNTWDNNLTGWDRLRFIINCLTRIRFCNKQGKLNFTMKGVPSSVVTSEFLPWFDIPNRQSKKTRILFGHWSALTSETSKLSLRSDIFHLDKGCVWGGALYALRLEDLQAFEV